MPPSAEAFCLNHENGESNAQDAGELLALRGLALLSLGRTPEATQAFNEALVAAPNCVRALLGQSHLALRLKDLQWWERPENWPAREPLTAYEPDEFRQCRMCSQVWALAISSRPSRKR